MKLKIKSVNIIRSVLNKMANSLNSYNNSVKFAIPSVHVNSVSETKWPSV